MAVLILAPAAVGGWGYHAGLTQPLEQLQSVYVVSDIDQWEYWLQTPREGKFFARFCSNQAEPEFSAGQTLEYLRYAPEHNCWGQAHYKIIRRPDGTPIRSN